MMSGGAARFLSELKRRKVYRAAVVYVVTALGVLGASELLLGTLGLETARPVLGLMVLVAFPIVLVLAWAYELKPDAGEAGIATERGPPRAAGRGGRPSIVVLPFSNLSPDRDDAYFSDGLTDEIITNLAHLHSARVISRSTAMVLKDTPKDVATIGRELGVDYVLEGSVRKAGEELRITAQLIDAHTDEHLWAERHQGTMGDVFEVQERIARSIAEALRIELSPAEERRLVGRPIPDAKAYEMWILAMHEYRKFSAEGIERAISLVEGALDIVGDNARLYASLGSIYWAAYDFAVRYEEATLDRVEECAARALELEPTLAQALYAKGLARYKRGDMEGFVRHARPAAEMGGDSDPHVMLGFVLAEMGRSEEARAHADEALEVDPLVFLPHFVRAAVDLFDGDARAAHDRIVEARDRLARGEPFAGWWVAQMAAYAGLDDAARQEYGRVADADAGLWTDFCSIFASALEGDRDGVVRRVEESGVGESARTDEYYPLFLANALALVGEHERAMDWLHRAVRWGFCNVRFLAETNRFLAPLRAEARFEELIAEARRRQEDLVV